MKGLLTVLGLIAGAVFLQRRFRRNSQQVREAEILAEAEQRADFNSDVAAGLARGRWFGTYAEQEGLHNPYGVHRPEAPFYAGITNDTGSELPT